MILGFFVFRLTYRWVLPVKSLRIRCDATGGFFCTRSSAA